MYLRKMLSCFRHIIHHVKALMKVDWIDTFRVNSKLPLAQFVKLPIWVYGCKIDFLTGTITIDSTHVSCGMIHLGQRTTGLCGNHNSINLSISGGVIFKGPGYMGNNSAIEVAHSGSVEFGRNFGITSSFRLACRKKVRIGENFSSSWDVQIFDTDFHEMVNLETGGSNIFTQEIFIGNDVWLANRVTVLKGAYIPDRSIVACNSVFNKNMSSEPQNTIYAGCPACPIKRGWTRREFKDFETNPMQNIVKYLHL